MDVLAARDTNAGTGHWASSSSKAAPGGGSSTQAPGFDRIPGGAGTHGGQPSPLTQQPSVQLQTPGTPSVLHPAGTPGFGLADDGSSAALAAPSRPDTAASGTSTIVDVSDVQRLVATVEGLQRQLALKNDRIKALRAALAAASANGASFTPASSRPGSAAAGSAPDARVLQQRLDASAQQVESLKGLAANLERQLADAQQAQQATRAQLAGATRQMAALLPADGAVDAAGSRPGSACGSLPATAGDANGVLLHQAHQFEQLVSAAAAEVERCRGEATDAQQQVDALTLQLASRTALVDALQTRHRMDAASGAAASDTGASHSVHPASSQLLAPPPRPDSAGGAATADALGSLDRIVGLWRQACTAKDAQLQELRQELSQVGVVLSGRGACICVVVTGELCVGEHRCAHQPSADPSTANLCRLLRRRTTRWCARRRTWRPRPLRRASWQTSSCRAAG